MSSLDAQLRPTSAIYLGTQSSVVNSPDPLDVVHPLDYPSTPDSKRLGQLPSPPHTNSTSGSTGDKDSANAGSTRRVRVPLPVVAVHDEEGARMDRNMDDVYDDYDQLRRQNLSRDGSPEKRPTRLTSASPSLVDRNREQKLHERLDRYANLSIRSPSQSSFSGGPPSISPQVKARTISLGRSSGSAAAAAAMASAGLTGSMRHSSLTFPRDRDVFDADSPRIKQEPLRRQAISRSESTSSIPMAADPHSSSDPFSSHSSNSNSTTSPGHSTSSDDRSKTPPATPHKRTIEISPGKVIEVSPRSRLQSEPTSPRRLSLLRHEVNVSSGGSGSLRKATAGRLVTVDEGEGRRDGSGSTKKSRAGIPVEFMTEQRSFPTEEDPMDALTLTLPPHRPPSSSSRQPSPGLYTSQGSPSLDNSGSTLASPFSTMNSTALPGTQSDSYASSRLSGLGSTSRRPRPAGLRNSYDRWGEPYEQWEKNQMDSHLIRGGDETDAASSIGQRRVHTDNDASSRRPGVRSVVNEGLRAAGLTRASTVGTSSVRRVQEEGRNRTMSDARLGDELVTSPVGLTARERTREKTRESVDLTRSGSSRLSVRDRSSSRLSTDDRESAFPEMDRLRDRARTTMLSPNVRPPVTIHNLLNDRHTGESPALSTRELPDERDRRRDTIEGRRDGMELRRDTIGPMDGRETPFNLRAFQSAYRLQNGSGGGLKAYTSPSGVQRVLQPRPNTSAEINGSHGHGYERGYGHGHHSANSSIGNLASLTTSNLNLVTSNSSGAGSGPSSAIGGTNSSNNNNNGNTGSNNPIQLLNDALYMFESHIAKLPHSNTMPDTYHEVLRDAKGIVNAAIGLDLGLRAAQGVCVEEMVEAESNSPSKTSPSKSHADANQDVADVWKRVSAEFREDVRVADELVRALTSFMIGAGRMLRSAQMTSANASNGHSRMMSVGDGGSVSGSISRAGGGGSASRTESRVGGTVSRSESRTGGSISRGVSLSRGGGSSDGRRSVEGWSRGIGGGVGVMDRRSVDGRRSVESPYMGDRTADEHRNEALSRLMGRGDAASTGSGGGSNGSGNRGSRVSFQQREGSRPGTSLSMIRDSSRDDGLGSPALRTFTSLSSRRSAGMQTPASANKALPSIPLQLPAPPNGAELSFPQTEDGGDRTPIELARPHMHHSTMPALAIAPPLPTLPSERLLQRTSTVRESASQSRHGPSNSITSASTTSTTRPKASPLHGTIRSSMHVGTASVSSPTTAITPTTARPRDMTVSGSPELSRGQSAAVNGLQQMTIANPPRKRTISTTDDFDASEGGSGSDGRLPAIRSGSSITASSSNASVSASRSSAGSPAISPSERKSSVRPLVNRRTSSMLSGTSQGTIHTVSGRVTPTGRRLVTRMSSAGQLNPADSASPSPITSRSGSNLVSSSGMISSEGRGVDSSAEEERRLRRSSNRMSLNAVLGRRPNVSDLLRRHREDDHVDPEGSPSSSAKERRDRRLAGQSW